MLKEKHKGAANELLATTWLLNKGYDVFRNVSQHGIFDLIAYDQNTNLLIPIDVKSSIPYYSKYTGRKTCRINNKKAKIAEDFGGKILCVDPETRECFWYK